MKGILAIGAGFLMVVLLVTPAVNARQDTGAKQDAKDAGSNTKKAAKKTGSATNNAVKGSGTAAKDDTKDAGHDTKDAAKKTGSVARCVVNGGLVGDGINFTARANQVSNSHGTLLTNSTVQMLGRLEAGTQLEFKPGAGRSTTRIKS
jgi:hypothetical protein